LWDNPKFAQNILKEREDILQKLSGVNGVEGRFKDELDFLELAQEEKNESLIEEAWQALENVSRDARRLQLEALLSGEVDHADCFLEINAGAGGTEAQDWTQMLARMYSRFADKRGFKVLVIDENPGDEAGTKSITLEIKGAFAYGWLKTETGVHRLVRISPFDSNARRHTSFASVLISPVLDESIDIQIEEKDLRIDTYRASGAGGQHVNKTESAIRITHLPTNVVVQCQNDRSQHRNRAQAMTMLKSKLYDLEVRKREDKLKSQEKSEIGWGNQIRSYVLQPYQMVKDSRTGCEKGNAAAVLDGEIDEFLESALSLRVK
jgi:peptide chain release factor 2